MGVRGVFQGGGEGAGRRRARRGPGALESLEERLMLDGAPGDLEQPPAEIALYDAEVPEAVVTSARPTIAARHSSHKPLVLHWRPIRRPMRPPGVGVPGAVDLNFYNPLKKKVEGLKDKAGWTPTNPTYDKGYVPDGRKAMLLDNALEHYKTLVGTTSSMKATPVANPQNYVQTTTQAPAYFSSNFRTGNISVSKFRAEKGFYTYENTVDPEAKQIWVDFANKQLGGGVFGNGFVQEETMFLETPELANAAAQDTPLLTRTGSDPGVLRGSPTPWLFEGAHRVMALNQSVVGGDKWKTISVSELDAADVRLTKAQKIDVLAMAAPKIGSSDSPTSMATIRDLFNTFVAGFQLARSSGNGAVVRVNTGPIGAGVFGNDKALVYVLQRLAAIQTGLVNLTFWGYDPASTATIEQTQMARVLQRFNGGSDKTVQGMLTAVYREFNNLPMRRF